MKKGLFITFEGVEGAGKTTQIELLKSELDRRGIEYIVTREPGGTAIGEKIRGVLLDPENKEMNYMTELLLYYASRAQHLYEKINRAKESGKVVICDRYSDSTMAYQGYGRGIDKQLIETLNAVVERGNKPDITFIIDADPEVTLVRAKRKSENIGDRLEQESLEFHKRVREGFIAQAKREPERIAVIDGNKSIEEINGDIIARLFEKLEG